MNKKEVAKKINELLDSLDCPVEVKDKGLRYAWHLSVIKKKGKKVEPAPK
jgi:hypothetical protein